eukprot:322674_1
MAVHAGADVGDRETARGALQQAHAQVGFQLADAAAQSRLGDAQGALGGGDSAVVDHHREVVQIIQVMHARVPYLEQYVAFNHLYPAFATTYRSLRRRGTPP